MIRKVLAAVALFAAVAAGAVHAQGDFVDGETMLIKRGRLIGGIDANSVAHILRTDESGNTTFSDAFPDRTWSVKHQNILQTVLVGLNRDSTDVPKDTRGANLMVLSIYAVTDSLVERAVLAISPRGHAVDLDDSLSTHPWFPCHLATTVNPSAALDTVGTLNMKVEVASGITDVANVGNCLMNEIPVVIPGNGFSALPHNVRFPLIDRCGKPFVADWTTIRARPVAFYDANGAVLPLTSHRISFQIMLQGYR